MSINFDSALGIHESALKIRAQRAEMLAENLANANTPGFKARDIDFKQALKMAATQQSHAAADVSNPNHMQSSFSQSYSPAIQYRTTMQASLDGNTVDEQIEQAQFMQNSIQYQASLDFLGGKFTGLMKAIRGD